MAIRRGTEGFAAQCSPERSIKRWMFSREHVRLTHQKLKNVAATSYRPVSSVPKDKIKGR